MRFVYLLFLFPLLSGAPLLGEEKGVVHAVLFTSPRCSHCTKVMEGVISPLMQEYEGRLQIVMVNIDTPEGQEMFKKTMSKYSIPKSRRVVPFMVIGTTTLVGSEEIERRLAFLIEKGLSAGGRSLPKIKGLDVQSG